MGMPVVYMHEDADSLTILPNKGGQMPLNKRSNSQLIALSKNFCLAILSPQAVHLIALVHVSRCKTIRVTFCPLNGSNQVCLIQLDRIDAILFCNLPDLLNLHIKPS